MNTEYFHRNFNYNNNILRLCVDFGTDEIQLLIIANETAWTLIIFKEDIIKQTKHADFKEYCNAFKKYLTSDPEKVGFSFVNGKLEINLLLENKMKVGFFTGNFKQVNFAESVLPLVDRLHNDRLQSIQDSSLPKKQLTELQKENENLNMMINTFNERRRIEEQKLYSSFVEILNEKKKHIRQLNDYLINIKKEKTSFDHSENIKTKKVNDLISIQNSKVNDILSRNTNSPVNEGTIVSHCSEASTSESQNSSMEDSLMIPKRTVIKGSSTHSLNPSMRKCIETKSNQYNVKDSCDNDTNKESKIDFSTQDLLDNI